MLNNMRNCMVHRFVLIEPYYVVLNTKQFYKQLVATLVYVWNITIHYAIERLTLLLTLYFLVPGVTVSVTVAVPLPAAFVA